MITISPMPPLGPYPQLLLCPHVGNTPTNAKMRIIRRIVPILICDPLENGMNYSEKIAKPCGWFSSRSIFARCKRASPSPVLVYASVDLVSVRLRP
jgi:hypothetical protein